MSQHDLDKWHGYRIFDSDGKERAMHIGPYPGRKSIALYYEEVTPGAGAYSTVLAYFRSEQDAEKALAFITQLAEGKVSDG